MASVGAIKLGRTVYRVVRRTQKKIDTRKGKVIDVITYGFCKKKFKIQWEDGIEEILNAKQLRLSDPTAQYKFIYCSKKSVVNGNAYRIRSQRKRHCVIERA